MVKLINWKNASQEEKNTAKLLLKDKYYDVLIVLKNNGFIEYIKSSDIDTNEKVIIRREKKNTSLYKEIRRLTSEKFTVKVVLSNLSSCYVDDCFYARIS
ncbi:hypothetical protein DFR86_10065 [Acidianus sulfidivorans JP7]|uniref:Uncharacterized protein n=1 Tax=Acidianus sulfidivorans JP7 TaxID=619593 RepID=A0A2U9IP74_9CREN|nr:hypothetical protein [Acidianus sulfidivorans]AWR97849.1 hypothetical protein DFR86_10065 [Acidianus sulfidivorans JP7]